MPNFVYALKQRGQLEAVHMTVCNVGSRKVDESDDYSSRGWDVFAPNLSIYGFDADADACDVANAELERRSISWQEQHFPIALSSQAGVETLYVTKAPMCSSLYPPNVEFINRFEQLGGLVELDFTVELETVTLDQFAAEAEMKPIDFLQIDVQGAELDVLKGAARALQDSVLALQVEVEFAPIYAGQPLFADVDAHLRSYDFTLFNTLLAYRARVGSPILSQRHPGQLLWGDAFYLYDLLRQDLPLRRAKTPAALLKLACVADTLDFTDYALELLEFLTLQHGDNPQYNFADAIVQTLASVPGITAPLLNETATVQKLQRYLSAAARRDYLT